MRLKMMVFFGIFLACGLCAWGGEIGFDEQFGLAEDRTVPLKQLIPGTEDYYYYHCLYHQQRGEYQKVREYLDQWVNRYNYTSRVQEIQDRQALLDYDRDPQGSLRRIIERLNLRFSHQKKLMKPKTDYPNSLDPTLVNRERLKAKAFSEYNDLSGLEDSALNELSPASLDPDRRRDFLRRLARPDVPGLAKLVVEDLRHENSSGFGSHPIHSQMLMKQLEECLELAPELINETNFVNAMISKMRPCQDLDPEQDPALMMEFLRKVLIFARGLPPSFNSLKANVLYKILVLERAGGNFPRDLFFEYLKLPRDVSYINPEFRNLRENRDNPAYLGQDYSTLTYGPAIGNDEPLVRSFLVHFLRDADDSKEFSRYIESEYLKQVFAETKILYGLGDQERWFSILPPGSHQALKERVDLEFLPTNKTYIATRDTVTLDVGIKNVPNLIVKIYKINTLNFYRDQQTEVTTALDLDGLVANQEKVVTYSLPEIRRHDEHFEFPQLDQPGVYVIELIGNGKSSRALIRKGRLNCFQRPGSAGHVFTVFDEENLKVPDASIHFGGREYKADGEGKITIPYSTSPAQGKFVVVREGYAALQEFSHESENYRLDCGFTLDREALVEGQVCKLLFRPELVLNSTPVDISLVTEPVLVITTTDRDGVATSKEVRGVKLFNDKETVVEFKVPEKLSEVSVALKGKVENLSQGKKIDLASSRRIQINGIDKTERIEDFHLRRAEGKYFLTILGKTGEPKPNRPVDLEFKHRDFRRTIQVSLQTDSEGWIRLGALEDIVSIKARGAETQEKTFNLIRETRSYPAVIDSLTESEILVPVMEDDDVEARSVFSLLERRGGSFVADFSGSAFIKDGYINIKGLPAGDFELYLKKPGIVIKIKVTAGRAEESYLLSKARVLEAETIRPVQIPPLRVKPGEKQLVVTVHNPTEATRVHFFATRFVPAFSSIEQLGAPSRNPLSEVRLARSPCQFLSGRNIGDEYQYILDRKYSKVFPGNFLRRPGLLLNPWSIRKTDTGKDNAMAGEHWSEAAPMPQTSVVAEPGQGFGIGRVGGLGDFGTLDFLPSGSLVEYNLKPDADGKVRIDISGLAGRQELHVVVVNEDEILYRETTLPLPKEEFRDLRLDRALDPGKKFAEMKSISLVDSGKPFDIEDITTAKVEVYDSLPKVYSLLMTLNADPNLAEFGFITTWPDLKPERKSELYSKYSCHELNFFLYKKDPEFFKAVVKPYLANKKDKTFLDDWLIESDLGKYLEPWRFGRLNIVERILLSQRVPGELEAVRRHVTDRFNLLPPDIERFNQLFKIAIKGSALDTQDQLGFGDAVKKQLSVSRPMAPAPCPPCPPPPSMKPSFGKVAAPSEVPMDALADTGGMVMSEEASIESDDFSMADETASAKEESKPRMRSKSMALGGSGGGGMKSKLDGFRSDAKRRQESRPLFRQLEKTEEWVENNYYHLPIQQQNADLVKVNSFWKDYADHSGEAPFLSRNFADASHNFPEMMFVLSVLDLPFKAGKHETKFESGKMNLVAGNGLTVFHREIKPVTESEKAQTILTTQNFFAQNDRYRFENNERSDKYVTDEFQTSRVYGCQVVVTNPTSTRKKIDILLQIPRGALPVLNGFFTKSEHRQLEPFTTQTLEYYFYFPSPGDWIHYPVTVAQNEKFLGSADPFVFKVVDEPTKVDSASWEFISQNGSEEDVIKFLEAENIDRLDLNLVLFRLKDKGFFLRLVSLLSKRHVFSDGVWAYGLHHCDLATAREYLKFSSFTRNCGMYIDCPLLTINPVEYCSYEHKEYWPLVNARVCQLGKKRKILNDQFFNQYSQFLTYLRYRPATDDTDLLSAVYYLVLQDRFEEAVGFFDRVKPEGLSSRVQYDYLKAYLAFSREKPDEAREIASQYREYPVDRWRNLFQDVLSQLDEMRGKAPSPTDKEDRDQVQNKLAQTEPSLDFSIEEKKVVFRFQNLQSCKVSYYLMDIELLFSRNPFVQEVSGQFATIHPNETYNVMFPPDKNTFVIELPEKFRDRNVMIEVTGAGVTRSKAYYPNTLSVRFMENFGFLGVSNESTGDPLPKTYVKVYARMKGGQVQFYKDGYTDLRGRFDYASLSTNDLDEVERFSILIMSDRLGSVVREAAPPKM